MDSQQVYVLRCIRFYGQIEGIFLSLDEIQNYLTSHPKQPRLPENAFSKREYWNYYNPENGYYSNYYFWIQRVPHLEGLSESQTWLKDEGSDFVLIKGEDDFAAVSKNEDKLKRMGLKRVFQKKGYHYNDQYILTTLSWLSSLLKRSVPNNMDEAVDSLSSEELELVWETRIDCDSWSTPYNIQTID